MAFWTQLIISSSSGGSITISTPVSGAVNGNNTQFVASSKPTIVVSDDASYRENYGWTWNSGTNTVTVSQPPNYDIYFIS